MASFYLMAAIAFFLISVAGIAEILAQRAEIRRMLAARAEWWDAYPALLEENTRAHNTIEAQREAHEELQQAFMRMRTGRTA